MTRLMTLAFTITIFTGLPAVAVEPLNDGIHKDLDFIMSHRLDLNAGNGTSHALESMYRSIGKVEQKKTDEEQAEIRKKLAEKNKEPKASKPSDSTKKEGKTPSKGNKKSE